MSNMNLQFVRDVYAMPTYLTSYLSQTEYAMSELMKEASKNTYGKDLKGKMLSIGNAFLTKFNVSTDEVFKRELYYHYL